MTRPRTSNPTHRPTRRALALSGLVAATTLLAACGGAGNGATATTVAHAVQPAATATSTVSAGGGGGAVLPVTSNPIANTATAATLHLAQVLVENNVDGATGKVTSDHLEIQLSNTGPTALTGLEVYYTFHDPKTAAAESYYTQLPSDLTIPAGATRTIHFDNVSATDHFPVNKFSLYYTDKNPLDVTIVASAKGAAVQTTTVHKDAGGAETAD